jgi:nickel superoxide dismutase
MKILTTVTLAALVTLGAAAPAHAHCQIPCGIYGDEMRFDLIDEHLETIAKSMRLVEELSAAPGENANQLTRWVMNKEDHASELSEILTYYFLDQRIKVTDPADDEAYQTYLAQLETIHRMMVRVMKCKQTTDQAHVEKLRELKDQLYVLYFGEDHEKHTH